MTGDTFLEFCVVLANLSPGNAPKWNPGVLKIYEIGLREVPDSAASLLTEAVIDACTFRPSVAEIKDLYRQISRQQSLTAFQIISHIMLLKSKYGRYGQSHPTLRNFFIEGPPRELCTEGHMALMGFGGWVKYCDSEDPAGVTQGHLIKFAAAVADGATSDTIHRLQLEYQEQMSLLPSPVRAIEHTVMRGLPPPQAESGNMTRLGQMPMRQLTTGEAK